MSDDIYKFNYAFLCMAQKLIGQDRLMALHQLGLSEDVASTIMGLSPIEMSALSESSTLLCSLKLSGDAFKVLAQSAGGDSNAKAHSAVIQAKGWR